MNSASNLFNRTFSAIKWNYIGTIVKVVLQFFVGIVLARILSPRDFGIAGMCLLIIGFGRLISDLGLSAAVIQREEMTNRHIRASFTMNWISGSLLTIIIWFGAPIFATLFNEPDAEPFIKLSSLIFVLSGISTTAVAMLRKQMKIDKLSIIDVISYILGYGFISILFAILGWGVWALIIGTLVQGAIFALLLIFNTRLPILPIMSFKEYKDLLGFGTRVLGLNVTNYFAGNAPGFFIGRVLGAEILGLYNRTGTVIGQPVQYVVNMLSAVIFPSFSEIQNDNDRLSKAFFRSLSILNSITMPLMFSMIPTSFLILKGLYGDKWVPATFALQILCIEGWSRTLLVITGNLAHSKGRIISEWKIHFIYFSLVLIALLWATKYGMNTVAILITILGVIRYILMGRLAVQITKSNWREFLYAHKTGIIFSIVAMVFISISIFTISIFRLTAFIQLLFVVFLSGLLLLVFFAICPKEWVGKDIIWLYTRIRDKIPTLLIKILDWRFGYY